MNRRGFILATLLAPFTKWLPKLPEWKTWCVYKWGGGSGVGVWGELQERALKNLNKEIVDNYPYSFSQGFEEGSTEDFDT